MGGTPKNVPDAAGLFPDPRVRHFWDPDEDLGRAMTAALTDRPIGPLWDAYLLYAPDAGWTGDLPDGPAFWMHQLKGLGGVAPRLDAAAFGREAERLSRRP